MSTDPEHRKALVGPARHFEEKRRFQKEFILSQGLQPHHTYLDIGCGVLRGGLPLIEYLEEGNYAGYDVDPIIINEARKVLDENPQALNKNPDIQLVEEVAEFSSSKKYDFVMAYAVLIHMTDEIVESCFRQCSEVLTPTGVFYANVNIGEAERINTWKGTYPVNRRPLEFYKNLATRYNLSTEDLGQLSSLGHNADGGSNIQRMLKFSRETNE